MNDSRSILYSKGKNDECYTLEYGVEPILKYIPKNAVVWCPFDKEDSQFVQQIRKQGNKVVATHIDNGQDFYTYEPDEKWDVIVSNPPFTGKRKIFERASWHYKSTEFKKQAVINTGLYDCYDDYFIAYKGIRSDRYSKFNFQYQYLPNQTYETFADYSDNEDSFGFSAWNYENAKSYCDELVVKVKIYYKDVARVVHNGNKIRACKITILD